MTRLLRLLALAACAAPATLAAQRLATAPSSPPPAVAAAVRDSAITQLESFLSRYPNSPLRPNALFQLGELLVRQADEQFAEAQRAATAAGDSAAGSEAPIRPDYGPAIARYAELVSRYPDFDRIDAAAYTLGTLYAVERRFDDAVRMFQIVTKNDSSRFRGEAFFRMGDAQFELASQARGDTRRQLFADAARSYEQATAIAPRGSDIWFLAEYKLGWSYYNQATQANEAPYRNAVNTFGTLVDAYDRLSPEQQARLGLRGEALEYMAVAFTQVGGAQAANAYFEAHGGADYRIPVMRRVAQSLRDQGDFPRAVTAYKALLQEAPTDSTALAAQQEIVDIYQNRMIEFDSAQAARLELVQRFAPGSPWAQANPGLVAQAQKAREEALRQSGQYLLAQAQQHNDRAQYAQAAQLYQRYMSEFGDADSARLVNTYYASALFGEGQYLAAGAQYDRAAYGYNATDSLAQVAGRNAIVAFDSALVHAKTDRATQDSLFASVDRFVAAFPNTDLAKKALVQKGRRASETQRWDVMAQTFRSYAERYPNDPFTPQAQKLVADALYKSGQYAQAQAQWDTAQAVAAQRGERALADTIAKLRTAAAATYADTLIKQGQYEQAAEQVYVAYADRNPQSERAPGALRDAIETYYLADSVARARGDASASQHAVQRIDELTSRLATQYPNYQYRRTYQARAAALLAQRGQREQAVAAYQKLFAEGGDFPGRADAMVRVAVMLDSLGRQRDAAQAYERFASAYPRDPRAPGAQQNAAASYLAAGDTTAATKAYGVLAQRWPKDTLAAAARQYRVQLLRSSGDTATANAELSRLCSSGNATDALRASCATQRAARLFNQGVALFPEYQAMRLVIPSRSQLSQAGVRRASTQKQALLKRMTRYFTQAIETGSPEYLAASTYYVGLAQWEYGNFIKNVQLPEGLSDEQRQQNLQGAEQEAQQFYEAARKTWQSLVEKAGQEPALKNDPAAQTWVERAQQALNGNVPSTPPTTSGGAD